MNLTQTLIAIEERKSTRTLLETLLTHTELENIASYPNDPIHLTGPHGNQFKFELVIETNKQEKEKIGTYGLIQNAQGYIIGTCWLGGRCRKQHAMSHLTLADDEIIPAIIPIGYSKEKLHLKDRLVRKVLKARKRKPDDQLFFYESFQQPLGDRAGYFQQALHYLRIGPSAQNKQPWKLVFNSDLSKVHFYITSALEDHPLYMCEPEYLDIGIAYYHFKAGLDESGITGNLVAEDPETEKPAGYSYITSWHRNN